MKHSEIINQHIIADSNDRAEFNRRADSTSDPVKSLYWKERAAKRETTINKLTIKSKRLAENWL